MTLRWLLLLSSAAALCLGAAAQPQDAKAVSPIMVEVKRRTTDAEWQQRETTVLAHLTDFRRQEHVELSKYGGLKSVQVQKTGFFHARKLDGRWWLVDPEGCLFLSVGVCAVRTNATERGEAALQKQFGSREAWAQRTSDLLRGLGFNTLGCWSSWSEFVSATPRLPYTTQSNFMSGYGKVRGGTYQQPGHTGYPNDCIFALDPDFETFCERHAQEQLSATKDDPYLFGHFSDNEMPLPEDALHRYLGLAEADPGRQAAQKWIQERNAKRGEKGFSAEDRAAFLEHLVARYYRVVNSAIKKADPNHMYLGSRFHGAALSKAAVFRGCSANVDVMSANYYGAWTPDAARMSAWLAWSGKPFIITEWYAKGMDSGMPNITGAGWTVKTQADRGRFYQNFTIGLLGHPGCVGWHWFKYIDNDPTDTRADPSNLDSNKGMVSNTYEVYEPLTAAMKELNDQAYPLRYHLAPH